MLVHAKKTQHGQPFSMPLAGFKLLYEPHLDFIRGSWFIESVLCLQKKMILMHPSDIRILKRKFAINDSNRKIE